MKYAKTIFIILAMLSVSTFLYGDNDVYRLGYVEGYRHGLTDRETGAGFNYKHDQRFQEGVSGNSYTNAQFRDGYKDGYTDGFSESDSESSIQRVVVVEKPEGFAVAYKNDGFEGEMLRFPVGRYAELDDEWEDQIESVQLTGNVRVILFEKDNFQGQSLILENDSFNLDELNFKERVASMIVEPIS